MATHRSWREERPQRRLGTGLLERIGNTPLLRFDTLARGLAGVEILAKAEWYNPGGSVKDRAAANIVRHAIESGALAAGKSLLDSTSGNTGIAYAMLGAALGFPVTLCVPENVSAERKHILDAYGAKVVYTPAAEGADGAMVRAQQMYDSSPGRFFYADQYSNENNWSAHYRGTAEEIWRQTDGRVTHFVAGLGTSGTFTGTTRRLKELNARVRCISVQPDSPFHGLEGMKHMLTAHVPAIYDPKLADENIEVATEDAYHMVKRVAREEGVLIGISAGAVLAACARLARSLNGPAVIVCVLADNADKYLSERFWQE